MRDSFVNKGRQSVGIHVLDHASNDITFSANSARNRGFAGTNAARSVAISALIHMPVFRKAANESLIDFDNSGQLSKILHKRHADAMAHIPSGFHGTKAHIAANLPSANSFLASSIKWITRNQSRSGLLVFSKIVPVRCEKRYALKGAKR